MWIDPELVGPNAVVQQYFKENLQLVAHSFPIDATSDEPTGTIFASQDLFTNRSGLIIVIQGSGGVRCGTWSRQVCNTDGIQAGSAVPYLDFFKEKKWAFILLNPNQNYMCSSENERAMIRGSESPIKHTVYVWDHFVSKCPASNISIVAHSFGGVCTMALLDARGEHILQKLKAIAFTDSVHRSGDMQSLKETTLTFLQNHCINWIRSPEPLDTDLSRRNGVRALSAGHPEHIYTSHSARSSVLKFIDSAMADEMTHTE
eukprot:TRINITY_DN3106_c0_g1::TRINITY_DN3106_c0_g1_i2::g.3621::m.3621 TRINITY_DN3106_c0_g1::TRINITY_DN3106_c0_g1_i2::g.3621  ORF type:complete len:260 (+),score=12.03,sp/Q7T297/F172A_DANRE/32.19/1e-45,Arb2/PF09757.4/2.1e-20,Abhydrolase_6/PF12697.2/0.0018,Abhydrolase_5/PF12695.2/0.017,Abhydrolase_1/PF00561.15/3.3e+03,Abhydrolase_1/PF00561.15/0.038,DUF676/PF05057.9/0.048,Ser_hydrolase/PF06821.8/1.5e+02,Ser_hydrolase/PF06821.8/0.98 TRINITY_DN3106_c0_g1_i2:29-808(+)